jgi:NitT/TauT family transport system substrate-binding protein
MSMAQSRRRFLTGLAYAATAGLAGVGAVRIGAGGGQSAASEPPPEITAIRLQKEQVICTAPQIVAEDLLRAEGFTDVHYVAIEKRDRVKGGRADPDKGGSMNLLAHGELDLNIEFAPELIVQMEAGAPLTILAGMHLGCYELLGNEGIGSIADLKGKTVGIQRGSVDPPLPVTIMARLVGLDPATDIRWITDPSAEPMQLFIDGKIDAFLAIPPETQELRARNIGHVIVNSTFDRPWSQYFCCMFAGNREFVQQHPIATKRALRAMLKANDLCASEPRRVAQLLVDRGYTDNHDYVLQMLSEVPYGIWRDFDPEDSMLWYALRLHEAGFIRSSPQKLIAEHADWHFIKELKRELKV